jgi:hypothetical protein
MRALSGGKREVKANGSGGRPDAWISILLAEIIARV